MSEQITAMEDYQKENERLREENARLRDSPTPEELDTASIANEAKNQRIRELKEANELRADIIGKQHDRISALEAILKELIDNEEDKEANTLHINFSHFAWKKAKQLLNQKQ